MKQQFYSLVDIIVPVKLSYYRGGSGWLLSIACALYWFIWCAYSWRSVVHQELGEVGLSIIHFLKVFCVYAIYLAFMNSSFSTNGNLWCREEERWLWLCDTIMPLARIVVLLHFWVFLRDFSFWIYIMRISTYEYLYLVPPILIVLLNASYKKSSI